MTEPHWGDIERPERPAPAPPNERLCELCAQVFTTPSGRDLLELLRKMHIERRMSAATPEPVLREAEAHRQLVLELEMARDRGLKLLADRQKKIPAPV